MQETKKVPTFKVGDKIKFEVGKGTNRPRWNYVEFEDIGKDFGESNLWADATIITVEEWYEQSGFSKSNHRQNLEKDNSNWYFLEFTIPDMIGSSYSFFPKPNCSLYTPEQWNRPGFFQHVKIITCECGGEKCKTTHSFWCPKYKNEQRRETKIR